MQIDAAAFKQPKFTRVTSQKALSPQQSNACLLKTEKGHLMQFAKLFCKTA